MSCHRRNITEKTFILAEISDVTERRGDQTTFWKCMLLQYSQYILLPFCLNVEICVFLVS